MVDTMADLVETESDREDDVKPELRDILENYIHLGYENKVILAFLEQRHGISISLSTLKRRLQDYSLCRREKFVNVENLKNIIREEILGPGILRGYRAVWHSLRLIHHIHVPRRIVAQLLRELDPEGTLQRRSRRLARRRYTSYGPNFCWHADGYDKLKPFGFPIHGAIDGYSRRVLWLEVSRSNNNPQVIAHFFLDYVRECSGCPMLLRTDCGTENGTMAAIQSYFRQHGTDQFSAEKSHKYGSSPSNQRIESWWSVFKRGRSSWWIDLFKGMADTGILELGNTLHKECLWFCFHSVLQVDLDNVRDHWNTHRIRPSRHGTVPGVPDVLYYLPQLSGGFDCKVSVSTDKIQRMELQLDDDHSVESEPNVYQEYFHYVMENENYHYPNNAEEALELFQKLLAIAA